MAWLLFWEKLLWELNDEREVLDLLSLLMHIFYLLLFLQESIFMLIWGLGWGSCCYDMQTGIMFEVGSAWSGSVSAKSIVFTLVADRWYWSYWLTIFCYLSYLISSWFWCCCYFFISETVETKEPIWPSSLSLSSFIFLSILIIVSLSSLTLGSCGFSSNRHCSSYSLTL